jgi:N-acyl-D-amino-acid deacylase
MYDIIIKNGTVIDGTGATMRKADVGIRNDKIVKIGNLHNEKGETEIDAWGKLVCPGFIDVNNHSDTYWQMFLEPDLESLVYQGITTIVGGNCGSSLAPLASAKNIDTIQKWVDLAKINVNWLTLAEFYKFLEEKKFSLNFATLVGHGTLQRGIMEDQMRSPSPKELAFIEKKLSDSLKEGALGMSTGLVYTHAKTASREELINLARIVRKFGGVYTTHIRGEGDKLLDSIEEAIEIAQSSKVKLHISHLKAIGEKNWSKMEEALALIEKAKEKGLDVSFDVYPYTNTGSVLYTLLPAWVTEGGKKMMLRRLKDPFSRVKAVADMKANNIEYEKIEISSSNLDKSLTRRKISEIAEFQNKSIEDAIIDLLLASDGRVIISAELLNEGNVKMLLKNPLSIVATNGAGYNLEHSKTGEMPHPRSFGTTMKIFAQYVAKKNILSWEEAVKKMTSMPAEKFGISKRGKIKENYFADVAILDQEKIASPATRENPYQYSRGVEWLLVNGKIILENGKYNGAKNGRVIKR